jgi:uncharacterized protein YqjF (DUF2071 family)
MKPLFIADWDRALFVHYEVDPAVLQPQVPLPLDLRDGHAYVSLVAFTMRGLRLAAGGRLTAWMTAPIATHGLLNVRTYVKYQGEQAIYFMAEWIPNRLSVFAGPHTYGLPYRYGKLDYSHEHESGSISGSVEPASGGRLAWHASLPAATRFRTSAAGSLSEFLLERYTAFTLARRRLRVFRIQHEPWWQTPVEAVIDNDDALAITGPWHAAATQIASSYAPGVKGVLMGRPRRVTRAR